MNIEHTCTDCGAGLEPPIIRCYCCGDPYCEDCMEKRGGDSDDGWLDTLRQWLTEPYAMPLSSLTHFAEEVVKMDIDIAREAGDEEDVKRLESEIESLNNGSMCVEAICSYALVGVLHEYDLVFEASLRNEQGDTTD